MRLNKPISLLLVIVLIISLASCSTNPNNDENVGKPDVTDVISEEISTLFGEKTTDNTNDNDSTEKQQLSEKATTEKHNGISQESTKNDAVLKKSIKAIIGFEYKGYREDFIDFDIFSKPEKELELIYNCDYADSCDSKLYPIDYDWYKNGVVDEDLLYERIVQNNRSEGILMTSDCKRIARMISQVAQDNIDYLKNKFPSFNFNIPLYHLDTVTVNTSDEEWYYSLYVYDFNRILVNFTDINTEKFFRSTVSHELFHLLNRGQTGLDNVYIAGSSVDSLETSENPLECNFINEYFVEEASYAAFGEKQNIYSYNREEHLIRFLALSTDTSFDDFETVAFGMNKSMIYDSFEKEVRNPNFVYSTLYALDISCHYSTGVIDTYGYDYFTFKDDCEIYATFNVMKNLYIRLLKEIYNGETTYKEACAEINNVKELFSDHFIYEISQDEIIDELELIFHEYATKL